MADYSGQDIISAIKRSDLNKPDDAQPLYRRDFGGTSAATPLISGVAALMISVNPNLNAEQVKAILEATADKNLDSELDLKLIPTFKGFQECSMPKSFSFSLAQARLMPSKP
ncbi:MAG: S8 family serine peptidase [Deinococcales bacterium]